MAFSLSHGKALDPGLGVYGFGPDELPALDAGPIDLAGWFDEGRRGLPLELEIGSGKGTFLVQQGAEQAGVNFIGIEYARAFYLYAADRMRRHAMKNARMVNLEAGAFLRNYVADGLFARVHIYFPDPWPKKRHNRRRFVQESNLRLLHTKLRAEAGGEVRIATDHADYFAWMEEHFARVADIFERVDFERPASAGEGELVGTNFERKYRREGRPFYSATLKGKF